MKYTRLYRPQTVIFDIDGTLCDVSSIRHLVDSGMKNRNFDAFHTQSVNCPTFSWVAEAAREAKAAGFRVVQVTARQQKYEPHTSWWLADKGIPSDALFMRPNGDFRPDQDVKRDILDRIIKTHDIVKAFDDNPSIVSLWSEYGVPCVVVPGWVG